jgi:hypothetical protein
VWRYSCFEDGLTPVDFCLWGWMKMHNLINTNNKTGSVLQGVSGGIVNILGGGSTDYSEEISSYKHVSNFQWVWRYSCFEVGLTPVDFCLWGWMKSEVYKEKVNTRDDLVVRIMNSAALIKQERQDDLSRATRTVAKRVEKCIGVDGGIFGHLL